MSNCYNERIESTMDKILCLSGEHDFKFVTKVLDDEVLYECSRCKMHKIDKIK